MTYAQWVSDDSIGNTDCGSVGSNGIEYLHVSLSMHVSNADDRSEFLHFFQKFQIDIVII